MHLIRRPLLLIISKVQNGSNVYYDALIGRWAILSNSYLFFDEKKSLRQK